MYVSYKLQQHWRYVADLLHATPASQEISKCTPTHPNTPSLKCDSRHDNHAILPIPTSATLDKLRPSQECSKIAEFYHSAHHLLL